VLGNGSNDVLELVARRSSRATTRRSTRATRSSVYPLARAGIGARRSRCPARDYGNDLDAMGRAVREDTKIVFIANPNNPTGTFVLGPTCWIPRARAPRVLVVVDEATAKYLPDELVASPKWLASHPNWSWRARCRRPTAGGPARRITAFAHPDVAELMNRVRQPFNVNHLALVAASPRSRTTMFIAKSRAVNARGLVQLEKGLRRSAWSTFPSLGNFITMRVGDAAGSTRPPQDGRHRPADRRLRHARAFARHRGPARAQRTIPRGARTRAGALMRRLKTLAVIGVASSAARSRCAAPRGIARAWLGSTATAARSRRARASA
jgi:histidinol-phosphate aminotransferase